MSDCHFTSSEIECYSEEVKNKDHNQSIFMSSSSNLVKNGKPFADHTRLNNSAILKLNSNMQMKGKVHHEYLI